MDNLIVALFEIISFGAIVVLVVLGLGIIASMMGIFNFAQGEFVLLGAYITYVVYSAGAPVWLGMAIAPFAVGALGFVLERLVVRRFYAAPIVAMLGTYALGLIIREIVRGLIGGLYISIPEPIGGSVGLGAMQFSSWRLVIILITALVMVASYLMLSRTAFGLRIRASLENRPCIGHFDQRDLRRDVCVRRRAGRARWGFDRAGVLAFRRSGSSLPHSGIRGCDGRRRRLIRRSRGWRRCDRNACGRTAVGDPAGHRRCPRVRSRNRLHQVPAARPRFRKRGLVRCPASATK